MNILSFTEFRTNLAGLMDKVSQDHKPILVTRRNAKPIVMMSLEDFSSYDETAYLMASPKNAKRLNKAISEISKGK